MGTSAVEHIAVELHGGCHPSGFETYAVGRDGQLSGMQFKDSKVAQSPLNYLSPLPCQAEKVPIHKGVHLLDLTLS